MIKKLVAIGTGLALVLGAALFTIPAYQPAAHAQFLLQANDQAPGPISADPVASGVFTNSFTNILGAAEVTSETARIPIRAGKGITLFPWINGNYTTATGDVIVYFDPATDGTKGALKTTTHPFTGTLTCRGTSDVIGMVSIAATNLNGIDWLYLTGGTNKNLTGTNVAFKGCRWSYSK